MMPKLVLPIIGVSVQAVGWATLFFVAWLNRHNTRNHNPEHWATTPTDMLAYALILGGAAVAAASFMVKP